IYYFANRNAARPELGSEVELAPNRRLYYDDEKLEGSRLERVQILGVVMLLTMVIGLPLYWVLEPSRQAGAVDDKEAIFVRWGRDLFETTANGGFNCAGCHGGMKATGGQAATAVTDPKTGEVRAVNWFAPALNTALYRFTGDEVRFILNYGRTFSPMSAWGTIGGGPMNAQQIETIIAYMRSIQITPASCLTEPGFAPVSGLTDLTKLTICNEGTLPDDEKVKIDKAAKAAAQKLVDEGKYTTIDSAMGEALFNLDINSGAYSCARCHTEGWSYGSPGVTAQGGFGWNLTGGSTASHFPNEQDMINFVKSGSVLGQRYGKQAQGSGRMPGFSNLLTDEQIKAIVEYVRSL
ncbi:MAG: cytochrome c, partial [Actinomycetota bacterium]|nr:cytochrome c [Actinomycetota bacterium]